MNESEAQIMFKKYLDDSCPEEGCNKPAGVLCSTGGVWIHLKRMTSSLAWKS